MKDELEQNNLLEKVDEVVISDELSNELDWQESSGLDFDELCGAMETIIFMSDRPVPLLKIKKLIDEKIPLKTLHDGISKLQKDYEQKHHGLRLVEVAEGYQFRTKAIYSKFVQDLFKISGLTLTPGCLEVLAIIAYRQPVTKFDIESIRGVDSSHLIRTLLDKRLVKISGRSNDMGRPTIYGTTNEFLDVFNLPDLTHLPPEFELEEIVDAKKTEISDISRVRSVQQGKFIFDETEEIDELAARIRAISTTTSFTKSLKGDLASDNKGDEVSGDDSVKKVAKTAFELLEQHVAKAQIEEEMKKAGGSELVNNALEISVVSDLLQENLNAPEIDEEADNFEMIDLDTGLPIEESNIESLDEDLVGDPKDSFDQGDTTDTSGHIVFDAMEILNEENSEEAAELEMALDKAFEEFKSQQQDQSPSTENDNGSADILVNSPIKGFDDESLDVPPLPGSEEK